jgi:hypothetical protein
MKTTWYRLIVAASLAVIAQTASATDVTVNNFSFEGGTSVFTGPGGAGTIPNSWTNTTGANAVDWCAVESASTSGYTAAADGTNLWAINEGPGSPTGGIYQDVGALLPNTTYTLTVAIGHINWGNSPGIISLINGTNNAGTLLSSTTGFPATTSTWQDYTASYTTGGSVSGDLSIYLSVAGANTYQANFDNVRLTYVTSPVPLPTLLTNTTPASATVAMGSNVVFTVAYSNSPPVNLQWQQIVSGLTNNINAGVITVTNNGIVSSTLTFTNVQLTNAGSYWLKAANATNLVTIVYSQLAPLTVIPTITWYAAGTYNNTFTNNSVLALAGSVANEVYGVNFGVGLLTTANGYVFDDYQTAGNMSVAGSLNAYSGYLAANSTGDGYLDFMLDNADWGTSANTAILNNLTVGQSYTVLVLLADTRPVADGSTFHVTDGLTVSPDQRYAYANGSPAIGGYIMGTFTAAATNQPLTVLNSSGTQYQAILLEKGPATPPKNPPELTADISSPLLYRVTTGGSVTFSVAAGGSMPLHYQWFYQSGPIGGANSNNYLFNAVAGTNSYYVIITNSFGSVTSSTAVVISSTNIVTVNNFSFEQDVTAGATTTVPTGWIAFYGGEPNNFIGSQAAANGQYPASPPLTFPGDENQFMYINNDGSGGVTDGVFQDVGALLANTTYTLTVAVGSRADWAGGNGQGTISLLNGVDQTGTLLASITSNVGAQTGTFTDFTATFTTSGSVSGDLIVDLSVVGTPSVFAQGNFDYVRLTKTSVAPPTLPIPDKPGISGGNLILTGTGGTANSPYTWLQTTNLSPPIIWTTNFTGTLDGTGAFSNAIPAAISPQASYFRFRMP